MADADLATCAQVNDLSRRFAYHLEQWTRGRTPAWARESFDPSDVVHDTLVQVARADDDAIQHEALVLRLRRVLYENVKARVYRARFAASTDPLNGLPESSVHLSDPKLGIELIKRYEKALQRLDPPDREAVIARAELGMPWPEVADLLVKSTVASARVTVSRALVRLAREMSDERRRG